MDIRELNDELGSERVTAWLKTLSDKTTAFSNEDELGVSDMSVEGKDMMLEPREGCPPGDDTRSGEPHQRGLRANDPFILDGIRGLSARP
jgi:hypothetical protein